MLYKKSTASAPCNVTCLLAYFTTFLMRRAAPLAANASPRASKPYSRPAASRCRSSQPTVHPAPAATGGAAMPGWSGSADVLVPSRLVEGKRVISPKRVGHVPPLPWQQDREA